MFYQSSDKVLLCQGETIYPAMREEVVCGRVRRTTLSQQGAVVAFLCRNSLRVL